jgi:DNA processing protein
LARTSRKKIFGWEKSTDLAGELKRIAAFGCHALIRSDENYPASLREIYDPPLVIYVWGKPFVSRAAPPAETGSETAAK